MVYHTNRTKANVQITVPSTQINQDDSASRGHSFWQWRILAGIIIIGFNRRSNRLLKDAVLACLRTSLELPVRRRDRATVVLKDEFVKDISDQSGRNVRERGDSGVFPTGGFPPPEGENGDTAADIARRVCGESNRRVAPDDDGIGEANDPWHHCRRRERIRRVDRAEDDHSEHEITNEFVQEDVSEILARSIETEYSCRSVHAEHRLIVGICRYQRLHRFLNQLVILHIDQKASNIRPQDLSHDESETPDWFAVSHNNSADRESRICMTL